MATDLGTVTVVGTREDPLKVGLVNADEYYLEDISLITPVEKVILTGAFLEISYFEDIMKSSITGEIVITDSLGLIDRLSMCGNEYLHLKFKKTRQSNTSFSKYFRIYRISERVKDNTNTEIYKMHFCSEELFLSEQIKVSKSYKNTEIHKIVNDLLNNNLKVPAERVIVQETKGLYDFIIPYKKPLEAINWLANYAQPLNDTGADFLFFENADGFNFMSLQQLYKQEAFRRYSFQLKNVGNKGTTELARNVYGIKSYTFLDTFDTLYGTNMGMFANKTVSIDPLTRRFNVTEFDYEKGFGTMKHLNSSPVISNLQNRLGNTPNKNSDAVFKVLTTNSGQKKADYIKDNSYGVSNDMGVETYVPNRTAQIAMAHYSRIKLSVPGDPGLTVGTTIELELPSNRGKDGSGLRNGQKDAVHSGKYIITSVRQIIDSFMKYETILEVAKDSYSAKLLEQDPNSISDAVKGKS